MKKISNVHPIIKYERKILRWIFTGVLYLLILPFNIFRDAGWFIFVAFLALARPVQDYFTNTLTNSLVLSPFSSDKLTGYMKRELEMCTLVHKKGNCNDGVSTIKSGSFFVGANLQPSRNAYSYKSSLCSIILSHSPESSRTSRRKKKLCGFPYSLTLIGRKPLRTSKKKLGQWSEGNFLNTVFFLVSRYETDKWWTSRFFMLNVYPVVPCLLTPCSIALLSLSAHIHYSY